MANIRSVCVYCGSCVGDDPAYAEAARALGRMLAREGIRLIYGGGGIGLMGELSQAVLDAGGEVTGVIPNFLVSREGALDGGRALIVTNDMHERKRTMFELADAFVTLPGGIGTLEELVEQLSWAQLGQHKKPVLIVNLKGYWDPLLALLKHQEREGFIRPESFTVLVAKRIEEVLPLLREAAAPVSDEELRGGAARAVAQEI